MIQISFSEEDKEALNHERFYHPHPRVQRRMEALWLKSQGLPHNQITKLTGITGNTIRQYLKANCQTLHQCASYIVFDNARNQKCALVKDMAVSLNIGLLYLPAYSPNPNLIERLWKFVKKQCLYPIYYHDFTEFKGAISKCLNDSHTTNKKELASLLTFI